MSRSLRTLPSRARTAALTLGLAAASWAALAVSPGKAAGVNEDAQQVFDLADFSGGLIVHVGCGDGIRTAAFGQIKGCVVHALDRSEDNVALARQHIDSLGLYGIVSADRFNGRSLPYVDNLVNLLVWNDPGAPPMDEVMRVLAPSGSVLVEQDGRWTRTVKPWPDEIDEWTHWLHDASGNAVAKDTAVGPPRHYQWIAPPQWSSHHDTVLSTSALVSAGGRVFSIVNEAPISEFHDDSAGHWFLVARDAFSGVFLWKLPIEHWGWKAWGESFTKRFAQPVQLARHLVAHGDRVYVTLGFPAPLSAVDAATGRTLKTYENARNTDEILFSGGKLIVTAYDAESDPAKKVIRAIDPVSGEMIWQNGPHTGLPARYDAVEGWDPLYLSAHQDRVVFVSSDYLACLHLASGNDRWRIPRPSYDEHRMNLGVRQSENCSLVSYGDVVLFAQPVGKLPHTGHTVPCDLYAFSAASGKTLWKRTCGTWAWGHQADIFVIRDLVWVHEHIPTEMKGPNPVDIESIDHALLGLDLSTGEIKERISTADIFRIGHHHRCYRNKATTNYIFTARRGTETTHLASGELRLHPWVRSECRYGIMPANGLVYTAPHPCACYAGVTITGYNALAASRVARPPLETPRLKKGPAYDRSLGAGPSSSAEWPTYRQNGARTGAISVEIESNLDLLWQSRLRAPLSAPTASDGRLYVAEIERHAVVALDAESGRILWRFQAGGRVDSPPTVARGRVVFGGTDGRIYCLDAADGAPAWRFRAAPDDVRMIVDDRLESVWPVHGSVLVKGDEVVATAGRSSYLDGGLHAFRLDLVTGRVIEEKRLSHEELTDRDSLLTHAARYDDYYTEGVISDVLVAHGDSVFLKALPVFGDGNRSGPLLTSHSSFLDPSLFERSFWFVTAPGREPIGAQLIVHDDQSAFGIRAYPSPQRGGPWHVLGSGYSLFAAPCTAKPQPPGKEQAAAPHVPGFLMRLSRDFTWRQTVPLRGRAMALTQNALLLSGSPDTVKAGTDPYAAVQGELGGKLLVISRVNGQTMAEHPLDAPPVWDGMAVASGRVFMALEDGSLACLGPSP